MYSLEGALLLIASTNCCVTQNKKWASNDHCFHSNVNLFCGEFRPKNIVLNFPHQLEYLLVRRRSAITCNYIDKLLRNIKFKITHKQTVAEHIKIKKLNGCPKKGPF